MSPSTFPQVQGGEGGGGRAVSGESMVCGGDLGGVPGLEWWGVGVLLLSLPISTRSAQPTLLSLLSLLNPDRVVLVVTGNLVEDFSVSNCLARFVLTTSRAV